MEYTLHSFSSQRVIVEHYDVTYREHLQNRYGCQGKKMKLEKMSLMFFFLEKNAQISI